MRIATIDDGRASVVVRPADMFRDVRTPYLRVLRVESIVVTPSPLYLAACSVYVQMPDGSDRGPRSIRMLVSGLTDWPYEPVSEYDDDGLWVEGVRIARKLAAALDSAVRA